MYLNLIFKYPKENFWMLIDISKTKKKKKYKIVFLLKWFL